MERENFFTKLRRVATSTESETARLKMCMEKPVAMRSSAVNRDGSSARLVLKEMQYDAQKTKEMVNQQLKDLHASSESFDEILGACEDLCEISRQQVDDLETYLEQYGYKKYSAADSQQPQQESKKKKKQAKENVKPKTTSPTTENCHTPDEKLPSTPPKETTSSAPPVDPNKTPQLADFGISQWTIDRLAHVGLNGATQDMKTVNFAGYQYGSIPSAIPSHIYPSTPQHSQGPWQRTPFTNRTILVTPGMFGKKDIPTETPSHFIDSKSYLPDSPVPPILMSSVKKGKPTTSDLRVTSRRGIETASPEPEPPTVTAWAEHIPLPAPPANLHAPVSAEVTPPMPTCLAPQATQAPMPTEPTCLAEKFTTTPALPCEPLQLSQQFSRDVLPPEPVQLAEKFAQNEESPVEPVQLMHKFGSESKMPQEPQLISGQLTSQPSQPVTPKSHQHLAVLDLEMPQTPELTMTYPRFVDVQPVSTEQATHVLKQPSKGIPHPDLSHSSDAPEPPVMQRVHQENQMKKSVLEALPASGKNSFDHPITPVTNAEFSQVADYLQRLIPMDVINQRLADINVMLAQKQDASFITEAEMQTLKLGCKTKAFTLLLAKLGRVSMGMKQDGGETVFYVLK